AHVSGRPSSKIAKSKPARFSAVVTHAWASPSASRQLCSARWARSNEPGSSCGSTLFMENGALSCRSCIVGPLGQQLRDLTSEREDVERLDNVAKRTHIKAGAHLELL